MTASAALHLDAQGCVTRGDEAALALNERAGGRIGAALALPALHALASAVRRLGAPLTRSVAAGDGGGSWELDVRAEPDGDGVRLRLSGWRERPAASPADRPGDAASPDAEWRWETDAAQRLTFLSAALAGEYGVDAAALLGRPAGELFIGDAPLTAPALTERRTRLRGSDADVLVRAVARHDAEGKFLGYRGAGRRAGPTASALAPSALARPLEQALRAPLGRIVADADAMRTGGTLDGTYSGYAADVAAAGRHLLALIDDLADLEAAERPDLPLAVEAIDLGELARRAGGLLAVRAAAADVTVSRPAADQRVLVRGDRRRALQVLLNLAGNAVRYSPARGTVTLVVEQSPGGGRVVVADQGRGIAPEDQARVFEKFERVEPSEPGGTGLGLYIARRLARAMGGDVTLESAPGAGARFALALPA